MLPRNECLPDIFFIPLGTNPYACLCNSRPNCGSTGRHLRIFPFVTNGPCRWLNSVKKHLRCLRPDKNTNNRKLRIRQAKLMVIFFSNISRNSCFCIELTVSKPSTIDVSYYHVPVPPSLCSSPPDDEVFERNFRLICL
jgi:hypothetical protein